MHDVEVLVDGLDLPECPRWHDGYLYWVNGPRIGRKRLSGTAEIFAELPTPMVLGLAFDADGSLLANAAKDRVVWRIDPSGRAERFADLSHLTEAPLNEIVALPDGGWLIGSMGFDPAVTSEVAATRLIVLDERGSARLTGPDLVFPNGMGWIGGKLLVAESFAGRLSLVDYAGAGEFGERRTIADPGFIGGHPDGVWTMNDDTAWYADAWRGVVSRIDASGKEQQSIKLPYPHALACCSDGKDERLFVAVTRMMPGPGRDFRGQGAVISIAAPRR